MSTTLDRGVVVAALVESCVLGDKATAERFGISVKSIQRYRAALAIDDALAGEVALKKQAADAAWFEGLNAGIRAGIAFLTRAAQEADHTNPEAIHAIAGGLKILATVAMTSKMLDVRLARLRDGQAVDADGTGSGPGPAEIPATIVVPTNGAAIH